jgi:hypothetical protein
MLKRMVYIVTTVEGCLETVSEMPHFLSIYCKVINASYILQFGLQQHKIKSPHIGLERLEQYIAAVHCNSTLQQYSTAVHCSSTLQQYITQRLFVKKVGRSNYV